MKRDDFEVLIFTVTTFEPSHRLGWTVPCGPDTSLLLFHPDSRRVVTFRSAVVETSFAVTQHVGVHQKATRSVLGFDFHRRTQPQRPGAGTQWTMPSESMTRCVSPTIRSSLRVTCALSLMEISFVVGKACEKWEHAVEERFSGFFEVRMVKDLGEQFVVGERSSVQRSYR